jgi:hypothetical protein
VGGCIVLIIAKERRRRRSKTPKPSPDEWMKAFVMCSEKRKFS